jgi:hypothetical protein
MNDWIFQANPKRYDLLAAAERGTDDNWSVKVHRQRVQVNDRVWFQIGGPQAGLYVVGRIVSPVYESEENEFGRWKADIIYDSFIDPPLLRTEILAMPVLKNFHPLKGIMGTNFFVPPEIASILESAVAGRLRSIAPASKLFQAAHAETVSLDQALRRHNEAVRRELITAINELTPADFEEFVGRVLEALGFDDIEVVGQTGDGGVDVRGKLSMQGITSVATTVQAKRWAHTVGSKVVRELRGALRVAERGLIVTTSEFSNDAVVEAESDGKAPIALIGGTRLSELCLQTGIGVETRSVPVYSLSPSNLV